MYSSSALAPMDETYRVNIAFAPHVSCYCWDYAFCHHSYGCAPENTFQGPLPECGVMNLYLEAVLLHSRGRFLKVTRVFLAKIAILPDSHNFNPSHFALASPTHDPLPRLALHSTPNNHSAPSAFLLHLLLSYYVYCYYCFLSVFLLLKFLWDYMFFI